MHDNAFLHTRFVDFVRSLYSETGSILLHRPLFKGNEERYLLACIESNFVSSIGNLVTEFEHQVAAYTGAQFAIATVNGTAALHVALRLAGVLPDDEVITQSLTFVATSNAVKYTGANPVYVDVDRDSFGMSPDALGRFLVRNAIRKQGHIWNKTSGRRIAACLPMHTFGLPCRIQEIANICREWGIALIEDAAESLGSFIDGRHTGNFGLCGTFSFNGNKIITTGGGGMIITNDEAFAKRAKHITTTAKLPHAYEFMHDEVGYNYRLPNLNAALGCAQMEQLPEMLLAKRHVNGRYREFFNEFGIMMHQPLLGSVANHWLNAILLRDMCERDAFLEATNDQGVMTRPIWRLMSELPMYRQCQHDGLENSRWLQERVVNVPSSVPESSWNRQGGEK
jgi:perosamine synthetase